MEKQKHQVSYLSSQNIVILWALIQSLGWGIIYLLLVNLRIYNAEMLSLGFIGLLSGAVMGALQHTLIHRGTGISLRHWLILTAMGNAAGLMSLLIIQDYFSIMEHTEYIFSICVFVIPAIFQWYSLSKVSRASWFWVLGNIVSSLFFAILLNALQYASLEILSAIIPAGLQGIASGFVVVWLIRRLPKQDLTLQKAKIG